MADGATGTQVLLVGLPERHVDSAVAVCARDGRVVIPAGSPGDLDAAVPGMDVLLMLSGDDAVPAVTWRATFRRRVAPEASELGDLLPPTWAAERRAVADTGPTADPGPDDEEDGDEPPGPQSFFEVERLEPLPKHEWIFANELVRKQERGGRTYFPRAPRLIRPPA
jgi:hypothetical protein